MFIGFTNNFILNYYGGIGRNLHLNSSNTTLKGIVFNDSFINSSVLVTGIDFFNRGTFELTNSRNATILGAFQGDVTLEVRNLRIITEYNIEENRRALERIGWLWESIEHADTIETIFGGNLYYTSRRELDIEDGIVLR